MMINKKIKAYMIVINLLVASFAFAFIINCEIGSGKVWAWNGIASDPQFGVYDEVKNIPGGWVSYPNAQEAQNAMASSGVKFIPNWAAGQGNVPIAPGAAPTPPIANVPGGLGGDAAGLTPPSAELLAKFKAAGTSTEKLAVIKEMQKAGVTSEATNAQIDAAVAKGDLATAESLINKQLSTLTTAEQGRISTPFGSVGGFGSSTSGLNAILSGLSWGLTVFLGVQILGRLFGFKQSTTNALSYGAGAAVFTGQTLTQLNLPWMSTVGAWAIGIGVGLIVFELTYRERTTATVTIDCLPWQAPTGGSDCEKCQEGKFNICSEYRCKSLGQNCQLLNAGTTKEACVWVNPHDVSSATIEPWEEVLSKDYKYTDVKTRPPGIGMRIINKNQECVKAFDPITFGITTSKPTQCKIDYNHTVKYDDMQYYMGETNLYLYNHSQSLKLPSPQNIQDNINAYANVQGSPTLKNDGTYTLYIRCQDANGVGMDKANVNEDEFAVRFCVEKGPDVTPPKIEGTSINNNMPVQFGLNETEIEVYTNEPADCKWARADMSYENMENSMSCTQNIWEINNNMLYKCKGVLTDIQDRNNNEFYFRCKDQPWLASSNDRNVNSESYKFILKGTQPLNIIDIKPNGTITGAGTLATTYLEIKTDNGENKGDATCSFSTTGNEQDYIAFKETGTDKHKQRLDLPEGSYTYYIQCVDLGGNAAYNVTTFSISIDKQPPLITRVYSEASKLKIITDEKSTCSYSLNEDRKCNFQISEGQNMPYTNSTEHVAEWKSGKTYYIKCADVNDNQPLPTSCSIIVKPQPQI